MRNLRRFCQSKAKTVLYPREKKRYEKREAGEIEAKLFLSTFIKRKGISFIQSTP
jgi:hypothetical protein